MEDLKGKIIDCPGCKAKSRLNVKKEYDGFSVKGYIYLCSFCGEKFTEDTIPFAKGGDSLTQISTNRCENCSFYAKNAWVQKCTKHGKAVDALSSCKDFTMRSEDEGKALF